MKYFIIISLILLSTGCSRETQNHADENQVVGKQASDEVNYGQQLIDNGFLDFADTSQREFLKSDLVNTFAIYNEDINRIAAIDAEALAEFNFDFFLPRLSGILERRKFKLNIKPADDYESSYDVIINGARVNLYSREALESGDIWDAASRNFFKEVNKQLKEAKVEESFYLLYGGNDLRALLLTPAQQKIIAEKYKAVENEIPYLP